MENISKKSTNAALWRRLAAILYDSTLIIAIWMIVGFITLKAFGITEARTLEGDVVVLDPLFGKVLFCAMMFSAFTFFSWFWTHSGQTLGMQAWKLKVQNSDGSAITYKQSLIRFLLAPCSFFCFGLGYFFMFVNPDKQTFHDKISKSEIIKIKR